MKLTKDGQIDYESNVVFEGQDAQISPEDMHKLWDLLQDPYKNSIGAVVREYVSNSFDAHSEADFIKNNSFEDIRKEYSIYKTVDDAELSDLQTRLQVYDNDAVNVTIGKDDTGHFWSTEDVGVGLSPARVKDVFCNYLKSTKEDTNNLIGAFGIGSKSGLSYNDVFFIRSRYNGMEYQYMLRKGEKAPRLDKVFENPTTERNGTEIKIYFKDEHNDRPRFREECASQLAYFDNVYFNDCNVDNDYVVIKGDNWLMSSNAIPFTGLHMCLGKVAYPIDWNTLKIYPVFLPVALKFEIGEIDIIQTREDVKYTPKTKATIIQKIEALKLELQTKWKAENNYQTTDLLDYLKNKDQEPSLEYTVGGHSFKLDLPLLYSESEYSGRNEYKKYFPTYEFTPFVNAGIDPDTSYSRIFFEYHCKSYINSSGLKHGERHIQEILTRDMTVYRISEDHITRKSKYVYSLEEEDVLLIRKNMRDVKLKNYVKYLRLDWDDRDNWRDKIKVFQKEVQKCVVANTKSYNKVVVDPQWIKDNYSVKRKMDNTKFNGYTFDGDTSYNGKWETAKYIKGSLDRLTRTLFVVGVKEQKEELKYIAEMQSFKTPKMSFSRHKGFMRTIYAANSNLQYFEDIKNLVTVGNFKETKPFIRQMTAYHLRRNPKYDILKALLESSSNIQWADIHPKLPGAIITLRQYVDRNNIEAEFSYGGRKDWLESCYEYAKEHDVFEKPIIAVLDFLYEYFKDIPLIHCLDWSGEIVTEEIARAIYRYNKGVPINKKKKLHLHYYINLNGEEVSWLSEEDRNKLMYVKELN